MPVDAPVKVSVVVPVYNPGEHIEPLIASLRRQSMPTDQFEAIFVDDGSTDATPARLDALAAETANVRVVHQPNSGWPGKPRNVGIDMARGEYLFFADNDDYLAPEALERMHAYALQNDSDVVLPKSVGHGRGGPWELYRHNRPRASLGRDPLLTILTPHKLFRRSMVLEHDIRFPEGRIRLEDHYFVMKAYFAADVISVLSDYPCYHWIKREARANASYLPSEPKVYYDSLRAVLDVIEQNTEPGELRDRLYAHEYHSKVLRRLCRNGMSRADADYRRRSFEEAREIAGRVGEGVDARLAPRDRAQSAFLRAGEYDQFFALAAAERGITVDARVTRVRWEAQRLVLEISATLVYADGSPVLFVSDGTRVLWVIPAPVGGDEVPASARDVTNRLPLARAYVAVRDRRTHVRHEVPTQSTQVGWEPGRHSPLTFELEAVIDPVTAAGGAPLGKITDVLVRITACGWGPYVRPPLSDCPTPTARIGHHVVAPYGTQGFDRLSLRKDRHARPQQPPSRGAGWRRVLHRMKRRVVTGRPMRSR